MAADDPHFRLRVPENLRDRIREAADDNKRSMNAEIVARLEDSFTDEAWTKERNETYLNDVMRVAFDVLTQGILAQAEKTGDFEGTIRSMRQSTERADAERAAHKPADK